MKIYTKTGDRGETGLFGGDRVSKSSKRIEAYGTIDELNSFVGLTVIEIQDRSIKKLLNKIQNQLFILGADLAAPVLTEDKKKNIERVPYEFVIDAETEIDVFEEKLEGLKNFILPGGSKSAALLHICRTITRRAERKIINLKDSEQINENIVIFLNRLSDLFFVLARYENKISGQQDIIWKKS